MKVTTEKSQNFIEVILNVKKGNVQCVNIFDNLRKKLTDNKGEGKLWICERPSLPSI